MINRRMLLSGAAALLVVPARAQSAAGKLDNPLAAVQRWYQPGIRDAQRPMTRRLAALYAAATRKSRQLNEPVSGLDFDPQTGSQDAEDDYRKSLEFSVEPRTSGNALVVVKLVVMKGEAPVTLFYEVALEGSQWKVDDVSNPASGGWRWSELLAAGAKGQ